MCDQENCRNNCHIFIKPSYQRCVQICAHFEARAHTCERFCLCLPPRSLISFCRQRTLHPSLYQATQLLAQVIPGVDEYHHLDGGDEDDDEDDGGGDGDSDL